jgi:hypothetical protein
MASTHRVELAMWWAERSGQLPPDAMQEFYSMMVRVQDAVLISALLTERKVPRRTQDMSFLSVYREMYGEKETGRTLAAVQQGAIPAAPPGAASVHA